MDVLDDIIFFKSTPAMFSKEVDGTKPNTVRVIEDEEIIEHLEGFSRINIANTDTNENFTRVLTDVSTMLVKGNAHNTYRPPYIRIFIFSWR